MKLAECPIQKIQHVYFQKKFVHPKIQVNKLSLLLLPRSRDATIFHMIVDESKRKGNVHFLPEVPAWLYAVKLEVSCKAPVVAIEHSSCWKVLGARHWIPLSSRAADPEVQPCKFSTPQGSIGITSDYYYLQGAVTQAWLCIKGVEFHKVTLLEKKHKKQQQLDRWSSVRVQSVPVTAAVQYRNLTSAAATVVQHKDKDFMFLMIWGFTQE